MRKLLFLIVLGAVLFYPQPVLSQDYTSASVLFGAYHDFDVKESGSQNWSPYIGVSVPLTQDRRFYGILGGEYGKTDLGSEYAATPMVLMMVSPKDMMVSKYLSVNFFMLLGPDVTWTDIQEGDESDYVAYFLTAIGAGGTIGIGEKVKLWGAYQGKSNSEYSTSRLGFGLRWAVF